MARKKEIKTLEFKLPPVPRFPITEVFKSGPPVLPEGLKIVEKIITDKVVVLRGTDEHIVGVNGVNHSFRGGENIVVPLNLYHILRDADLIEKEI